MTTIVRASVLIALLGFVLAGCSVGTADLSHEKSPNSTGSVEHPSTDKAPHKFEFKTQKRGQGDEVRQVGGDK